MFLNRGLCQVQSFDTTTKIAVATFPRPVKKGYLYKVLPTGPPPTIHPTVHPRPFVGVSQKSIFKRPCQVLAINAHKMAPRTG